MRLDPLERIIKVAGGCSALAKAINEARRAAKRAKKSAARDAELPEVTPQMIVNWRHRGVPPRRVLDVELAARAVGAAVTRHDLRPDLYPHEACA